MKKYRDHYFEKAKRENYPARSVYKLEELDQRFGLLKPGQHVLDLGAAPGSWTLYAAKRVGASGRVLSLDLSATQTAFPGNVTFLTADAFSDDQALADAMREHGPFDIVVSDMAPKTTGVKLTDQTRSLELCERAFELAQRHLKPGGAFVAKIFEGPDVKPWTDELRKHFDSVKGFKPKSSRSESKETFVTGLGFRPGDV